MSQTENVSTESKTTTAETHGEAAAASVVTALFDVGSAWARYGLRIGKMALETSAQTLSRTAQVLEKVATDLERKGTAEPPKDA